MLQELRRSVSGTGGSDRRGLHQPRSQGGVPLEAAGLRVPGRGVAQGGPGLGRVRRREQSSAGRGGVEEQALRNRPQVEVRHPRHAHLHRHQR